MYALRSVHDPFRQSKTSIPAGGRNAQIEEIIGVFAVVVFAGFCLFFSSPFFLFLMFVDVNVAAEVHLLIWLFSDDDSHFMQLF